MTTATSRARWKRTEREVADKLGGRRVPVSGRTRGDVPDVAHDRYAIEVKHRESLPQWIKEAMLQAIACRKTAAQIPLVVLHEKGKRHDDDLCVVRMRDLSAFLDNT